MYTIKEVAKKTGISEHTLRFYENNKLIPFVSRDKNNVRLFSDKDLEWLKIVQCLRTTDMKLSEVKRYVELCLEGDHTIPERFDIIKAQKDVALEKQEQVKHNLEVLEMKEKYYQNLVDNKLKDPYNPANNLEKIKTASI